MMYRLRSFMARTVLLALLAVACVASAARGDIRLDLFPGFDNACRPYTWTPLTVRLTGAGIDAPAKLQVVIHTRQQGTRVYATPLRLHAGTLNEQHSLYYLHPDLADVQDMAVQLLAEGRVVAEKKLEGVLPINEGQPVVVGLTQDQSGLNFLSAIDTGYEHQRGVRIANNAWGGSNPGWANNPNRLGRNPTRVLYPRSETLPDASGGYAAVDALVLGDLPLDTLTDAQWEAIVDWVKDGGVLVVSGGADINRVRGRQLAGILPVAATGVRQARALPSLAYRYGTEPRMASVPVLTGTLKPDAMALCRENGAPVVAYRKLGTGIVVFTAFDLLAPEFRAWPGQARLWPEIMHLGADELRLSRIVQSANQTNQAPWMGGYNSRPLQDALAGVQSTDAPSFTFIGFFLLAYIVFLVPVNYLLLKKRDKKELAWITAPLIIIAFSTGAYAVGYSIKGGQLFLRYCSIIEGAANTDSWSAYTVTSIFSPRQTRYDLSIADPAALPTEITEEGASYQRAGNDLMIERGQATTVKNALVNMWDHRSFDFESRVTLDGGISASVSPAGGGMVSVKVTNGTRYALSDCSVMQAGSMAPIGAMAPGESRAVQIAIQSGNYAGGLPLTTSGVRADPTVDQIKQALSSIIAGTQVMSNDQRSPLVFTGWFTQPVVGLSLAGEQPKVQGINLLVAHLPVTASAAPPRVWTPPPSNPDPFSGRSGGMMGGMGGGPPVRIGAPVTLDANGWNNRAYTYANQGNLKAALDAANRALALAPNDGNILDSVAEMHQRRKEYATAAKYYVKALAHQGTGGMVETHEKYGETLLALGRKQEGIKELRVAARADAPNGRWGSKARAKLQSLGVRP